MTENEIESLKRQSRMLSRIAAYLEDFVENDDDSTLICVLRLLARYHSMEADSLHELIAKEEVAK